MSSDYEDKLLSGKVTQEEKEKVLSCFARAADIADVSSMTGVPVSLVEKTLNDPDTLREVLEEKKKLVVVSYVLKVYDRLLQIVDEGSDRDSVSAARLLKQLIEDGVRDSLEDPQEDEEREMKTLTSLPASVAN